MNRDFALKLHRYLLDGHFRAGALIGPDPGVRFNYRIWRFLKSALSFVAWRDEICYMQTQGYWILANWLLSSDPSDRYGQLAMQSCDHVIKSQRADGAWEFPNPEWRGRVTTVEGIWAALGLLETFRRTGHSQYLEPVLKWDQFFRTKIGFQKNGQAWAVNYFAHDSDSQVPNNSALALRYLARLNSVTRRVEDSECVQGLIRFLSKSQSESGEFPYEVGNPRMRHFQCFQYHAFMLMDLFDYYSITQDESVMSMMRGIATFLQRGVSPKGEAYYQCGINYRTVHYHSAAVAASLKQFEGLGRTTISTTELARMVQLSDRIADSLLSKQRADGSLPHSRGDYRVLADHRSYPRYLAMILLHSLMTNSGLKQEEASQHSIQPNSQLV